MLPCLLLIRVLVKRITGNKSSANHTAVNLEIEAISENCETYAPADPLELMFAFVGFSGVR